MFRTVSLERLARTLAAVAREKELRAARRDNWPLSEALRVHLWLYANGLVAPTRP